MPLLHDRDDVIKDRLLLKENLIFLGVQMQNVGDNYYKKKITMEDIIISTQVQKVCYEQPHQV